MAEPILQLDQVGVRFDALKAVDGVSLRVARGERRAIIGPNGAGKTTLWLLDEPAAGLSPAERVIVADIIRALPGEITIVLIEHDMDLVLSLVDWVTCLNNGQFLAEGAPADIRNNADVQNVYLGRPHHHA